MTKAIERFKRQLEKRHAALAKERDRLRDLRLDVTEQEDNVEQAMESLDETIDKLSELV